MSKLEDWFLRGRREAGPEEDEGITAGTVTYQDRGGKNLADEEYCTHCGASLVGGASTAEYCGDDGAGSATCGESLEGNEGDTACPHCGEAIEWPEDADGPVAPDNPPGRLFEVEVTRRQKKTFVNVLADGPEAAKRKVEAILGLHLGVADSLGWETVESFTSVCLCREA